MARSREFCIEEEDGRRTDKDLHSEILENRRADETTIRATRRRLVREGMSSALARRLMPLPEDKS